MTVLTIVIPFYKRVDHLKLILSELCSQASDLDIFLPVIIVDSNSVNDLHSTLEDLSFPCLNISLVQTINSVSNKRNLGAKLANSEYIAFIDDDCLPSCSYLSILFNLVTDSSLHEYIFSGLVSFPNASVHSSHYIKFRQSLLDLYPRDNFSLSNAENAYSMNFLIKRSILLDLLFSETISTYGWEDYEFFFRVLNSGHLILNGNFHVFHLEYSNFSNYINKMFRYGHSLQLLKISSPIFFESLSFNRFLSFFSGIPPLILRFPLLVLHKFISLSSSALGLLDQSLLNLNLFFVFRALTRLAFLVGYLKRPSSSHSDNII